MTLSAPLDSRPRIAEPGEYQLAEGPMWDARTGRVWWVDIVGGSLHSARLERDELVDRVTFKVGGMPGCIVPLDAERDGWLLARDASIEHVRPDGSIRTLFALAGATVRFNDGGCDPAGRFFVGTTSISGGGAVGVLYRIDPDGRVSPVLGGVTMSNGIAWSPDGERMYYVDSATHRIDVFDYDVARGEPSNRRAFAPVGPPAQPDGIAADDEGGVWVAVWDGGEVRRHDATGRLTERIRVPVSRPTSCAFAGGDLDVLVVTSARAGLDASGLAAQPDAGRLFTVRTGHRGVPCSPYRGSLDLFAGDSR